MSGSLVRGRSRAGGGAVTLRSALVVGACADVAPPDAERGHGAVIRLVPEVTLSDAEAPFAFGTLRAYLVQDRRGRIHVRILPFHQFAVFDKEGSFLQYVGVEGQGPGEYAAAFPVAVDHSDSLWVWDPMLHRATIYSGDLDPVRTVHFPFRPHSILEDGTVLVIQTVRDPELIGFPAHRISRTGEVLSSFGQDPPQYRFDRRRLFDKVGGADPDGLVWLASVGRYELELWDPEGNRRLRSIRPDAPWFRESHEPAGDFRIERPSSSVHRLWVDDAGPIWVLITTAARDWAPCCTGSPDPREEVTWTMRGRYYDWVLQAIDPDDGAVLAEQWFDQPISTMEGGGRVVAVREDPETGLVSYTVLRPTLVPSTTGGSR